MTFFCMEAEQVAKNVLGLSGGGGFIQREKEPFLFKLIKIII